MKVFISYAHSDALLARRLAEAVEAAGFDVWRDDEVLPGENWAAHHARALEESSAMLVLLTPNTVHSGSLASDVSFALGKEEYKGRVIPVLTVPKEELRSSEVPWILHRFNSIVLPPNNPEAGFSRIIDHLRSAVPAY